MTKNPVAEARRSALRTLSERERGRISLNEVFELATPARSLAHDIALGVRRHQFLLDALLRVHLERSLRELPDEIRELLRIGAYDLVFRDRIPRELVVNECVNLAGRSARWRGLVNAVLRRIGEAIRFLDATDHEPDRRTAWVRPGRFLQHEREFLPDPATHLVEWFSKVYTLPESFAGRLHHLLPLEAEPLFRALSTKLPVAFRPTRRLDFSTERLAEEMRTHGVTAVRVAGAIVEAETEGNVGALPWLAEGRAVVQDLVAAEVAPFVDPKPGERILDLCAPPGGKTIHLAELQGESGEIVAAYSGTARLGHLADNIESAGLATIKLHDLHASGENLPAGPFDRILVDAPCSNTGVLMKRVDARFRATAEEVARLADIQLQLLLRVVPLLRPGGCLIYSTCSLLPQENGYLTRKFLKQAPSFTLEEEHLRYPHRTSRDGGFMSRLRQA